MMKRTTRSCRPNVTPARAILRVSCANVARRSGRPANPRSRITIRPRSSAGTSTAARAA